MLGAFSFLGCSWTSPPASCIAGSPVSIPSPLTETAAACPHYPRFVLSSSLTVPADPTPLIYAPISTPAPSLQPISHLQAQPQPLWCLCTSSWGSRSAPGAHPKGPCAESSGCCLVLVVWGAWLLQRHTDRPGVTAHGCAIPIIIPPLAPWGCKAASSRNPFST